MCAVYSVLEIFKDLHTPGQVQGQGLDSQVHDEHGDMATRILEAEDISRGLHKTDI